MTTLLELRTRARQRADMVDSQFVPDSELNTYLNLGYTELYDLVVAAYEDYFTKSTNINVASGDTLTLPADFYKLRGLDYNNAGVWLACREFNFVDRNTTQTGTGYLYSDRTGRGYRVMGDTLLLQPTQSAAGTYRVWYASAPIPLVSDSDSLPSSLSKFGWDEYAVLYAAERMLSKEESSITDVQNERAEIAQRIKKMASDRQIEQSSSIQDVQGNLLNQWGRWYDP